MTSTSWTFVLLGLAIASLWLPPVTFGRRTVPVWPLCFAASLAAGAASGVLAPAAWLGIAVFGGLAWGAAHATDRRWRGALTVLAALAMLALAVHAVPGFRNPKLLDQVRFSAGAPAVTQYLNFDKGVAGLFALAALVPLLRRGAEVPAIAMKVVGVLAVTAVGVFGVAWGLGHVAFDPKLPPQGASFLAVNLLFTCVAEEAFFRGLLQARLAVALAARPRLAVVLPVGVSALLFGAVHLPGGLALGALATLGGLGYATAYAWTGRIEAAIAVHFGINAIHVLAFTYPALAMT